MVALVKCNWTNRRKRHLRFNKLGDANNYRAAAAVPAGNRQRPAAAAAAKTVFAGLRISATSSTIATASCTTSSKVRAFCSATATACVNYSGTRDVAFSAITTSRTDVVFCWFITSF